MEEQLQLLDNKDYRAITNTSITVKEKRKGGERGREKKHKREKRKNIHKVTSMSKTRMSCCLKVNSACYEQSAYV